MKIFFSPECLAYKLPGHPESPERIRSVYDYLKAEGVSFVETHACEEQDILRVHSRKHLESVRAGSFIDADTPSLPHIFEYALLSAGAAILASEETLKGESAFSLMRPPGHHATRDRVMGFCYFNNIAVAAAKYLEEHPGTKVAILDIDCHHGNGTEAIFLGNPGVLYVSLHQSPLYPGTGHESRQNSLNFPLFPGTGESGYLDTLEEACGKIADFHPTLLGVSAGFDTFQEDPLAQFDLRVTTYRKIENTIAGLGKPTFAVMEGGYSPKLPECVFEFLQGLEE